MVNKTCDITHSHSSFKTNDNLINETLNRMNDFLSTSTITSNYGDYNFTTPSNLTDNDTTCSVICWILTLILKKRNFIDL